MIFTEGAYYYKLITWYVMFGHGACQLYQKVFHLKNERKHCRTERKKEHKLTTQHPDK
jgi:hypothetical protein